jgi:hypothetical protein
VGTGFFVHQRTVPAVKKVEVVSDRMSYIELRGHCCNIIVLNVLAMTEEKNDYSKDSFYKKLEHMFDHLRYEILMQNWGKRIFSN